MNQKEKTIAVPTSFKSSWQVWAIVGVAIVVVGGWLWWRHNQAVKQAYEAQYSGGASYEAAASEITGDTTYYNDYFGFSYTVPRGWVSYDVWDANFSTEEGVVTDLGSMEVENFGTDRFLSFIDVANEKYSESKTHQGIIISAENSYQAQSLEDYMRLYNDFMLAEDEVSGRFSLEKSETVELAGRNWEKRVYLVNKDGEKFYSIGLITPLRDNFYLAVETSYWEENEQGESEFIKHVGGRVKFF